MSVQSLVNNIHYNKEAATMKVKKEHPGPIYQTVYHAVKNMITEGVYAPGDMLPTEPELEKMFSVSRTTVRKAVGMLLQEGMVSVKQGYGTQVLSKKTVQNLNRLTSVSQTLTNMGYEVGTKSIYIDLMPAPETIAADLAVPADTTLVRINRIQTADGAPVAIAKNYIPLEYVPGLESTQERIVSLYAYLQEHHDLTITGSRDSISASNASFEESELLKIEPRAALITINRICYSANRPVEVDRVKIIASKYEFEVFMEG